MKERHDAEIPDDHDLVRERQVVASARATAVEVAKSKRRSFPVNLAKHYMKLLELFDARFEIPSPGTVAGKPLDRDQRRSAEPNRGIEYRFWTSWIEHSTFHRSIRLPETTSTDFISTARTRSTRGCQSQLPLRSLAAGVVGCRSDPATSRLAVFVRSRGSSRSGTVCVNFSLVALGFAEAEGVRPLVAAPQRHRP